MENKKNNGKQTEKVDKKINDNKHKKSWWRVRKIKKSIDNALGKILPPIVPFGPPVLNAFIDQVLAKERQLTVSPYILGVKPGDQFLNGLISLLETLHGCAVAWVHQLCQYQNSVLVLS